MDTDKRIIILLYLLPLQYLNLNKNVTLIKKINMKNLSFTKVVLTCSFLSMVLLGTSCKKKDVSNDIDKPMADFSYNDIADPLVVFTNNSKHATSYLWEFGDGYTSKEISPSHLYTANGTYTVSLTAYSSFNGDNKATKEITITGIGSGGGGGSTVTPTADFSYLVDTTFTVRFTNKSSDATSYKWDFGDNSTSTNTSPSHTYTSRGVKRVILTAYNGTKYHAVYTDINMTSEIRLTNNSSNPYSVTIDNIAYPNISGNTTKTYEVNPGTHSVKVVQQSGYTLWATTHTYSLKCIAGYSTSQSFTD